MKPNELQGRIDAAVRRVIVTSQAPNDVIKQYAAVVAKNAGIPLDEKNAPLKAKLAREAAGIFESDIADNPRVSSMSMNDAIKAADFTDPIGSVGLLSGTLVMQKALPAMMTELPLLNAIATDFSDEVGTLNQTATTRIVLKPAVQIYDPTLDSSGRPNGWTNVSPAQTVDVSVTMTDYVGIPLVFGIGTIEATTRRLFEETSPLAVNALGEYAIGKLAELMTPANFNAYKETALTGAATTSGSATITYTSSDGVYPGQEVSGTGIPSGTYIASVESATSATLTRKATATGSSLTLALSGGLVPDKYTTYARALDSFSVADLDTMAGTLDTNKVPKSGRFAALLPKYYRKLGSDAAVNALMQATGDARYLTERRLPKISDFELLNSAWMPTAGNQTGFVGHKASLVLKTRLPMVLNGFGGVKPPGSVTTITDPGSGLSVLLVQYMDLKSNFAEWRPEIILGAAVGDRRGGLVMTSE